jgi:lipopolysaccharide/colanic/teichoic acid biosynthesis glycosyltransferase
MINNCQNQGLPRAFEIFLALAGLIVFAPVMVISAALVAFEASGSIIFRQKRIGRGGAEFTIYKFRTMKASASGALITAEGDSRITKTGAFLRKYKLDEMPELYNILKGEMSFVGPRPEVPDLVDLNSADWQKILGARPGLTDPVTLRLRNEEALLAQAVDKQEFYRECLQPFKIKGYVHYVENRNWRIDAMILLRTLKAVMLPQTAMPPSIEELKLSI